MPRDGRRCRRVREHGECPRSPASSTQMTPRSAFFWKDSSIRNRATVSAWSNPPPSGLRSTPRLASADGASTTTGLSMASMAVLIVRVFPVPAAPRMRMTWSCESQTWRQIACCSRESLRSANAASGTPFFNGPNRPRPSLAKSMMRRSSASTSRVVASPPFTSSPCRFASALMLSGVTEPIPYLIAAS